MCKDSLSQVIEPGATGSSLAPSLILMSFLVDFVATQQHLPRMRDTSRDKSTFEDLGTIFCKSGSEQAAGFFGPSRTHLH